jgi:predicted nucleic acid-binding Zn ribbon protein
MKKMKNIYWDIVKNVADERAIDERKAFIIWAEIVGKKVSNVTSPIKIINGKMIVRVKNSVWRNELVMLKEEILKKYQNKLGNEIIKDIKFV